MNKGETKNLIKKFKLLPKKGMAGFVDFSRRAAIGANELIKDLLTKNKGSEQEVEEAAKYAIAKQFVEMYETRYTKTFVKNLVNFYSTEQAQEFIRDHVSLETQKILISETDRDIFKRRDRADGIMIIPKLAEKLEVYKMEVSQYEAKHPEVETMLEQGEERFGEQEVV